MLGGSDIMNIALTYHQAPWDVIQGVGGRYRVVAALEGSNELWSSVKGCP